MAHYLYFIQASIFFHESLSELSNPIVQSKIKKKRENKVSN